MIKKVRDGIAGAVDEKTKKMLESALKIMNEHQKTV
jgi:hypothetical protein